MKRLTDKIQLWTLDDFASSEECEQLIKVGYEHGYEESQVQNVKEDSTTPSMKTYARNSNTSFIKKDNPVSTIFIDKAKKILESLKVVTGQVEDIQIQRYKKGQKFNPHYDSFENKTGTDQRSWTVMCYLGSGSDTEDLEGGGTLFTKLDLRIVPKKGMAVIWNNLDPETFCRQQDTMHMGEEVNKGTKYIVTIWFHNSHGTKYICKDMDSFTTHNVGIEKFEEPLVTKTSNETYLKWIILLLIFVILAIIAWIFFSSR